MTDARRAAFEAWYLSSKQPNIGLRQFGITPWGSYAYGSVEGKWEGFQAALDWYESRLESDEVVEAVQEVVKVKAVLHCEFPEMRMSIGNPDKVAKAALAAIKEKL